MNELPDVDLFSRVAAIGEQIADLGKQIGGLSSDRRKLVRELHDAGYSHAEIAEAAGVSRGRVFQILQKT